MSGRALSLAAAAIAALPAAAATVGYECRVADVCADEARCAATALDIRFAIDGTQFVDPVHRGEPPRRKVTTVTAGRAVFAAEPFVLGDVRGFYADAEALGHRMLSIAPDGRASYAETVAGRRMTGTCRSVPQ
ncbi:hypothetical protein DXV76_09450 [Rhodobacteraceae bacterium CCMM004]|nr:hypothetical protein DXV76_09450 [Rhodobacteraceae bacterium CCMM004]